MNDQAAIERAIKSGNYGKTVKDAARDLLRTGVATFDMPPDRTTYPGSPWAREASRVRGYVNSLSKIFGHPIKTYEHHENGERFIAVSFE